MPKGAARVGRAVVSCVLAACLVALPVTAVVADVPHEWIGMATFALTATHAALSRRGLAHPLRQMRRPRRVVDLVVDAALVGCMLGLMASALVLSRHVFAWLPTLPGVAWARELHMGCSYWYFVLAFTHAGLHLDQMAGPLRRKPVAVWLGRASFAIGGAVGAWSFARLGLISYLTLSSPFFAAGATPLGTLALQYASVAILITGTAHYARSCAERPSSRKDDG